MGRRQVRRRGRAGGDPAAPGRADPCYRGRGRPRRYDRRVARQAAPGLREGRQHHRGQRQPAHRRRRRRGGDAQEQGAELGLDYLAEIGAHGVVAGPDSSLQHQPSNAIKKACEKQGITPGDLDLLEINEAFAAVGLASTADLGVDPEKVNVDGGAIAIGHPLGASGARIVLHLALELARRGGGTGAAGLCGAGGRGDALIITVPGK
ncbi:hypothetical protein MTP03_13250 [Tsukamurella sp. PLM1]|nr:hypothetical protein MTP03_13250 [Tsukamurella sp. PLM1]